MVNKNFARMCDSDGVQPYFVTRRDGVDCVWAESVIVSGGGDLGFWGCGGKLALYARGEWMYVSVANEKTVRNFFEKLDNVLNPPDWAFEMATTEM